MLILYINSFELPQNQISWTNRTVRYIESILKDGNFSNLQVKETSKITHLQSIKDGIEFGIPQKTF